MHAFTTASKYNHWQPRREGIQRVLKTSILSSDCASFLTLPLGNPVYPEIHLLSTRNPHSPFPDFVVLHDLLECEPQAVEFGDVLGV